LATILALTRAHLVNPLVHVDPIGHPPVSSDVVFHRSPADWLGQADARESLSVAKQTSGEFLVSIAGVICNFIIAIVPGSLFESAIR